MTADERNRELIKQIQNGNQDALAELYKVNKGFIKLKALRFYRKYNSNVPMKDLMQEATIGLFKAAKRMDLNYSNTFITYADYYIFQSLYCASVSQGYTIYIPQGIYSKIIQMTKLQSETNNNSVIAEKIGCSESFVEQLCIWKQYLDCQPLDVNEYEEPEVPDISEQVINSTLHEVLEKCIEKVLTKKEADVVKRRNGYYNQNEPETLEGIAREYGLTRERIRQIEMKAYRKLRKIAKHYQLDDYLK